MAKDPDCKEWVASDCGNQTRIPIVNLTLFCNKPADQPDLPVIETPKPLEPEESMEPAEPEEPQFLSSTSENPKPLHVPEGRAIGGVIGFAALMGVTVLICVALVFFLRQKQRRLQKFREAVAYDDSIV